MYVHTGMKGEYFLNGKRVRDEKFLFFQFQCFTSDLDPYTSPYTFVHDPSRLILWNN